MEMEVIGLVIWLICIPGIHNLSQVSPPTSRSRPPENSILYSLMAILLCFFWIFVFLSNPTLILSQFNEFFYNGFKDVDKNISLNGVAEIQKNGILRLTNEKSRLVGRAFYSSPLQFRNAITGSIFSFSTSFAFAIVPEYEERGGHGLAFVISPTQEFKGALPSQYLGLINSSDMKNFSNQFLAVEFDTVQDFEFVDINDNHVGIDMDSLQSFVSAPAYFNENSKKQDINLKSGKKIMVWIDYDSAEKFLNVTISPTSTKPNLPILSIQVDLSLFLHSFMYVGFSASTGLLASSHYIFGWSFKINGSAQTLNLSSLPSLPRPPEKHTNTTMVIIVLLCVVVYMLGIISVTIHLVGKIKNRCVTESWELDIAPHRFSYKELKLATMGFREKDLLGFGGFGRVYKGTLPNSNTQVAVKRISHESKQGLREFVSEVETMGRLRHRNLVQLLGWCRKGDNLLLVYDFMANGSLDKFIFNVQKPILSWLQRFKIIKGVASALVYLHEGWEKTVIHRDVKASNVLLDSELNGRLSDFGLARLYEHGSNPSTTRVVGTMGYLAPELARTGKVTTSTDVYAFGTLMLEVTCGRKPIEEKPFVDEVFILIDWVWEKWRDGRLFDVVDPRLMGEFDEGQVMLVLKLGLMCSSCAPTTRPSMRQVVRYLEGDALLPDVLSAPGDYGGQHQGLDYSPYSYPWTSISLMEVGDGQGQGEGASASPLSLLSART